MKIKSAVIFGMLTIIHCGAPSVATGAEVVEREGVTHLHGVMYINDVTYVSFRVGDRASWMKIGESFMGYRLLGFDAQNKTARYIDSDGNEFVERLVASKELGTVSAKSTIAKATPFSQLLMPKKTYSGPEPEIIEVYPSDETGRTKEGLDWDWIKSPNNPMAYKPIFPTTLSAKDWILKSKAEKDNFVELYRQCGWDVTVIATEHSLAGKFGRLARPK